MLCRVNSNSVVVYEGNYTCLCWMSCYAATLKPRFTRRHLIPNRILVPCCSGSSNLAFFDPTRQSLQLRCRPFIAVDDRAFEHLLQIGTKYNFPSEYFRGFAWFPTSVRPNLTVRSAARRHLWRSVPWQKNLCFWSPLSPNEVSAWSFSSSFILF